MKLSLRWPTDWNGGRMWRSGSVTNGDQSSGPGADGVRVRVRGKRAPPPSQSEINGPIKESGTF